jgi:hypothetical protein
VPGPRVLKLKRIRDAPKQRGLRTSGGEGEADPGGCLSDACRGLEQAQADGR